MQNLHLIPNDKFTNPYIKFINQNFEKSQHLFLIIGKGMGTTITMSENIIQLRRKRCLVSLVNKMNQSEKIFLHGLFHPQLIIVLFFQPWLLKKCSWIVWGGDLYYYSKDRKTLKEKALEFMRRLVIKNIGGLITHIKGDYELAQLWYRTRGKHYYSFFYPSNLYKEYDLSECNKSTNKTYIQIGNSADPSNNHIEIFEKLSVFNNKEFEVICPLSYGGSNEYLNKVIEKGKELFGKNFVPITEFMPFEKYLETLAKIDLAIFNHNRQQAVGNITTLLSLGKKVYIRDDITTWGFCEDHGLKVYSLNFEFQDVFTPMPDEIKNKNKERMKEQFSEKKLVSDWEVIFSSKI